jgi:hypothetical protein
MPRPLLYNFYDYLLPEGVPELLELLGFWTHWNSDTSTHQIYERNGPHIKRRMKWVMQEFRGGSTKEWQQFLSKITAAEHVL